MPGIAENLGLSYGWPEEYPALGFDPAPGRTGQVAALAKQLATAGGQLQATVKTGQSVTTGSAGWQGESGSAYRGSMAKFTAKLTAVSTALAKVSPILSDWQTQLAAFQARARLYEAAAAKAQSGIKSALRDTLGGDTSGLDRAEAAQDEYEAAVADAKRLLSEHEQATASVAAALRAVVADAPKAGDLADLIDDAPVPGEESAWEWINDAGSRIGKLGDVVGDMSAIAGAWGLDLLGLQALATASEVGVPVALAMAPVTAATEIASISLALGAGGLHGLGALMGGDVSGKDLLWDAFGIATLNLSRAIPQAIAGLIPQIGQFDDTAGHFNDYWTPKHSGQEKLISDLPPGLGNIYIAFKNAWDDAAHDDDEDFKDKLAGEIGP